MSEPKRMRRFGERVTLSTDNIPTNDISQTQDRINIGTERTRKKQEYLKKYPWAKDWTLESFELFENNATPISVNGVVRTPVTYKPKTTTVSKDTKTKKLHEQGLQRAKLELEKEKELEQIQETSEIINDPTNPIGWVPGLRTLTNVGADLRYSRLTGESYTPYTANAAMSLGTDALTLGFGIGPWKNYAGSYVGTVAGGLIGDEFDSPYLGQFIGGVIGGFSPLIYRFGQRNIGTKYSRLASTMNLNIIDPEWLQWKIPKTIRRYKFGDLEINNPNLLYHFDRGDHVTPLGEHSMIDDFIDDFQDDFISPPPEDYDAMLSEFKPAFGDQYTNVNGYSVNPDNLNAYKTYYPDAANILFGETTSPYWSWHFPFPIITSDISQQNYQGVLDYFNQVVKPLAKQRGYDLELPTKLPKFYREIPYYESNELGEVRQISPDENRLGGWFDPNTLQSYISLVAKDKASTITHEWLSHGTDKQLSLEDMNAYNTLIKYLLENLRTGLKEINKFKIPESANPQEMRATLNQVRDNLIKQDKIKINSDGTLNLDNITDSDILNAIQYINGYGNDYISLFNTLDLNKQKSWLNLVRNHMSKLPVIAGGAIIGNSVINDNNSY